MAISWSSLKDRIPQATGCPVSTASFSHLLFIQTTWQGVKFGGNNFRLLQLQWRRGSKTGSAAMPLSASTQHILIPVSFVLQQNGEDVEHFLSVGVLGKNRERGRRGGGER